jgi:hypothetical protein
MSVSLPSRQLGRPWHCGPWPALLILGALAFSGCRGDIVELRTALVRLDSAEAVIVQRAAPPDSLYTGRDSMSTGQFTFTQQTPHGILLANRTDSTAVVVMDDAQFVSFGEPALLLAYDRLVTDSVHPTRATYRAARPLIIPAHGASYVSIAPLRNYVGNWAEDLSLMGNGTPDEQESKARFLIGKSIEVTLPIEIAGARETYRVVYQVVGFNRYPDD